MKMRYRINNIHGRQYLQIWNGNKWIQAGPPKKVLKLIQEDKEKLIQRMNNDT